MSVKEKAHEMRQVCIQETSASEPSLRCRKHKTSSKLETSSTPGQAWGRPVYCLSGDRHRGGVNWVQALIRNVRTCRLDAKGTIQAAIPQESEYRCEAQGRSSS